MYKNETNRNLARPEKTVGVEQHRARLEEDGVKLDLTVVRKLNLFQQLQVIKAQICPFVNTSTAPIAVCSNMSSFQHLTFQTSDVRCSVRLTYQI